ncbi:MAG: hydroxymethylbilane synthase [Rickettsiales bacterium]|nr:hydroxymethylbilane synthase [Rickettsiales bacterium]
MAKTIKIGTRTSALAMAQTREVASLLKSKNPTLNIEIVGVKNVTGDVDKKTPLQALGTIGVFTKEIDEMVLNGDVDIAVHSLKDIGTQRPGTLQTIAIPERVQPHDCILFNDDILDKIKHDEEIIIGASSPRRIELVPPFLEKALPQLGTKKPKIKVVPIRGNVPSRIEKLKGQRELNVTDVDHLDGICIAFAGVSRLFNDENSRDEMQTLLKGLRWMILPLSQCPGAPGQGALAIEALEGRDDLRDLLLSINKRAVQKDVLLERNILIEHGGGCHQAFGVTAIKMGITDDRLLVIKGKDKQGNDISENRWLSHCEGISLDKLWNGHDWRNDLFETDYIEHPPIKGDAVFVSNARALDDGNTNLDDHQRIWTAGVKSWYKLAAKGYWVEGCADSMGYDLLIRTLLNEPVLGLPTCDAWNVLTHADACEHWEHTNNNVISTYKLQEKDCQKAIDSLKQAENIFWSSYSQYQALKEFAPANATHICGPGKTAELLRKEGLKNLVITPSLEMLKEISK